MSPTPAVGSPSPLRPLKGEREARWLGRGRAVGHPLPRAARGRGTTRSVVEGAAAGRDVCGGFAPQLLSPTAPSPPDAAQRRSRGPMRWSGTQRDCVGPRGLGAAAPRPGMTVGVGENKRFLPHPSPTHGTSSSRLSRGPRRRPQRAPTGKGVKGVLRSCPARFSPSKLQARPLPGAGAVGLRAGLSLRQSQPPQEQPQQNNPRLLHPL